MSWYNVFFLNKLNYIGNRLGYSILPSFHGTKPVLDKCGYFPLCVDRKNGIDEKKWKEEQ